MLPLNLPKFSVKVTEKAGKPSIWDPVRRKFVALTPEEMGTTTFRELFGHGKKLSSRTFSE